MEEEIIKKSNIANIMIKKEMKANMGNIKRGDMDNIEQETQRISSWNHLYNIKNMENFETENIDNVEQETIRNIKNITRKIWRYIVER